MKVLIVGAGAVGQVYAYHLQRGGAEVSFFVRPQYVAELEAGIDLYPLNQRNHRMTPVRMSGFGVHSDLAEISRAQWDYVILCTSSTVLHTPFIAELIGAIGAATFVSSQAGLADRAALLEHIAPERVVSGLITLISYHAPLRGEQKPVPGMAYWFPPFSKAPFRGPEALVSPLIETFRRGGFACAHSAAPDDDPGAAVAGTLLSVFVLSLEAAGWKLKAFLSAPRISVERQAMREALAVVSALYKIKRPWFGALLTGLFFKTALAAARLIIPFNLEIYLETHFTKVRPQMHAGIDHLLAQAKAQAIAVPALAQLAAEVRAI